MKPDLTYYHKSPLHLKNFLYFPEKKTKKTLANFPTTSLKNKKDSYILERMLTKGKIKKFLILQDYY